MGEAKKKVMPIYNDDDAADDAATVVIDFNAIKSELANHTPEDDVVDIQFQVNQSSSSEVPSPRKMSEEALDSLIDDDDDDDGLDFDIPSFFHTKKYKSNFHYLKYFSGLDNYYLNEFILFSDKIQSFSNPEAVYLKLKELELDVPDNFADVNFTFSKDTTCAHYTLGETNISDYKKENKMSL